MKKLAIKKLKPSDLSFFKSYFVANPTAKQKGFNLDTRVMEGNFYPSLKARLAPLPQQAVHVDLTLSGPGLAGPYVLSRKIKIDAKNLRLNGEFIHAPHDDPNRYDEMGPGDFALFEFDGEPMPTTVKVVLIGAGNQEDDSLHRAFEGFMPGAGASMRAVSEEQLQALIEAANPAEGHPIRGWLDVVELERLGTGDGAIVSEVNRRRPGRGLTQAELRASKEAAERVGQLGEILLDLHLTSDPEVERHEWVARENAISPFDFNVVIDGVERHVDAKSTSGRFASPVYLSVGEIRHATGPGITYDIYRLFEVTDEAAKFRVAKNIGARLSPVVDWLGNLPAGVSVDTMSFAPDFFGFEPEVFEIDGLAPEDE